MNESNLFVLAVIGEQALLKHWSFRADDELSIARRLLREPWEYQDVFWALRITPQDLDHLAPEQLLEAIHNSYPNNRVRAVLYLLRVSQPADCVQAESLGVAPAGGTPSHKT